MERPAHLQIHVPRLELTQRLNDHVVKRFGVFDHPLHVTVDSNGAADTGYETRVRYMAPHEALVAHAAASDVFACVDACAEKLRAQVTQLHDKKVRRRRQHRS